MGKELELGTNINGIDVKLGCENKNEQEEHTNILNSMEFTDRNIYLGIDAFKENDMFYYLARKVEWHEIIKRRFEGQENFKFTYSHKTQCIFKVKLMNQLKVFDINFDINSDTYNGLQITYDVKYY